MCGSLTNKLGTQTTGTGSNRVISVAADVPIGDLVLVVSVNDSVAPSTPTDSRSNTYAEVGSGSINQGHVHLYQAVLTTALVAADSITVNAGSGLHVVAAAAFTGATSGTADKTAEANAASASALVSGITALTVQESEVAVGCFGHFSNGGGAATMGAGFSLLDTVLSTIRLTWGWKQLLGKTVVRADATATVATSYGGFAATFKANPNFFQADWPKVVPV